MERTTDNGVERSADGGVTWVLVAPSEQFLAARAAAVAAAAEQPVDPAVDEVTALDAFRAQLDERLADPNVNSIAEIKSEIRSALALLGG